jgi:maltodextrin utilization protein YvdJ
MACPVCYAPAADAAVRESMNLGIFVLLGITFVVLAGFARFFLALARRSRAADEPA